MAIIPDHEIHPHFGALPQSAGFPKIVQWGGAIGIIMIFVIGFLSFRFASYHHVWPAEQTQRCNLSPGVDCADGEPANNK